MTRSPFSGARRAGWLADSVRIAKLLFKTGTDRIECNGYRCLRSGSCRGPAGISQAHGRRRLPSKTDRKKRASI